MILSPSAPWVDSDRYRELFQRSADAILIIEGDRFVDCNPATVKMLGYPDQESLLRMHPSELSPPTQPDGRLSFEKANEMMELAASKGSHRFEWVHRRADGTDFPVEVLLTSVPREGERVLHTVWRDITERKRLEDDLRQAQKMEAIGNLVGGIAHDFNNLLVSIIGHSELLTMKLGATDPLRGHAQEILAAGERAGSLVSQLLVFSRKQVARPEVLDVHAVIKGLDRLLGRLLGDHIQVTTRLSGDPLRVLCDAVQLEQVVLNLATNARDSMPDGGEIVIEARSERIEPDAIGGAAQLEPGAYFVLSVTDTGTGIAPDVLDRIFKPFFTTKAVGHGTGLGLSTVRSIVRQNGGDVLVHSVLGHGSVFEVYMPLSTEALDLAEARQPLRRARAREHILVVEDDGAVAGLVRHLLEDAGYVVSLASSGVEALRQGVRDVDLLVTDVIMPGLDGVATARKLSEQRPGLRVLYLSGYPDDMLLQTGVLDQGDELLTKPFSAADLLSAVGRVIDGE